MKSRVLSPKYGPKTKEEAENIGWKESDVEYDQIVEEISLQIRDLVDQQRISNAMAIDQFLNPITEVVENNDDDLINVITDAYSKEEKAYESDEEDISERKISLNEAIQAVHTLRLYEEQANQGDQNFIKCLKNIIRSLIRVPN